MLPYNSTGTESSLSLSECDDPKNKDSVANCGYDLVGNFFQIYDATRQWFKHS